MGLVRPDYPSTLPATRSYLFASPPPLGPFLSHFICGRSMAVSHSLHIVADHLFSAPCVVAILEHFVWQNCLVNLSVVLFVKSCFNAINATSYYKVYPHIFIY